MAINTVLAPRIQSWSCSGFAKKGHIVSAPPRLVARPDPLGCANSSSRVSRSDHFQASLGAI